MSGDKVTGITPDTEVSDRSSEDFYHELQVLVRKYEGHLDNAEAMGVLQMMSTKIFMDTHRDYFDSYDGAS